MERTGRMEPRKAQDLRKGWPEGQGVCLRETSREFDPRWSVKKIQMGKRGDRMRLLFAT